MAYLSQTSILTRPVDSVARWRLIASVTLLAALLAVSVEHVYLISRTAWYEPAYHLSWWAGIWYSAAAVAAALVLVPVSVYVLRERPEFPANLWLWVPIGVGFGIFVPLMTGFFTPLATLMIDWSIGNISASDLPPWIFDRLLRGVFSMFVDGAPAVRHGLAAGAVFAFAGYAVDRLNSLPDPRIAFVAPFVMAVAAGLPLLLLALQGSPEFLRNLL